ncbi:zf-CSL-domain-containing protein [Coemansia reversa NRRL 1564]|uniref:Diphthamide biosynthesis protein 3 n=1 Tax=Coemansia reversa (strain ATCC 12441 / NRRL 1564) TaxID=763665 RepID=A0A2G5BI54_COERN|nr:zf-CSL-domain-containing protein [Coemansia reversa NRRL 1564]|eukprot:PIA18696.1 zf-CSL-domain-containing protein [Coemansia reversa NRRL 1564]
MTAEKSESHVSIQDKNTSADAASYSNKTNVDNKDRRNNETSTQIVDKKVHPAAIDTMLNQKNAPVSVTNKGSSSSGVVPKQHIPTPVVSADTKVNSNATVKALNQAMSLVNIATTTAGKNTVTGQQNSGLQDQTAGNLIETVSPLEKAKSSTQTVSVAAKDNIEQDSLRTKVDDSSFYDEIEIEDMEYDDDLEVYHYPCPCGDRFEISMMMLEEGEYIAKCPSCSLLLKVIYDENEFGPNDDDSEVIELSTTIRVC